MYIFAIILFFIIALIEAIFISTHSKKYIIISFSDENGTRPFTYSKCFYTVADATKYAYYQKILYYDVLQLK